MLDPTETRILAARPAATSGPDAYLAAIAVSEEAARTVRERSRRRRSTGVALATVVVLTAAGTNVAAAATRTLWFSAPGSVVAEATDVTGAASSVTSVSFTLLGAYVDGVDASTPGAEEAFQESQRWLLEHPIAVAVPHDAQTLDDAAIAQADAAGVPRDVALEQQAVLAAQPGLDEVLAQQLETLSSDLASHLVEVGLDPTLIAIDPGSTYSEVS